MRIGVSGAGSIGRRHIRLLGSLGVDVDVFDARAGTDLGADSRRHDSFDALLAAGIDGLVVATPDEFHAPQAVAACNAGIPVLVEKPLADTVAAAEQIAAASDSHDVPVLVGYVLRHDALMRQAKASLEAGELGEVVSFHLMLGAYETLEVARNRFDTDRTYRLPFDYSHEWDYLQWFLGPVRSVAAVARTGGSLPLRQNPNVIDVLLDLHTGVTGTAHLDYVQRPGVRHFTLMGDRATLHGDVGRGVAVMRDRDGTEHTSTFDSERDTAFVAQLQHFLAVIERTEPPVVDAAAATRALVVADAVVTACSSDTRVHLPA